MPYGNYSNNNKKGGPIDPTIYSPYRFNNAQSTVDQTSLTTQFWNKTLRISISPKNPESPTDQPTFDMKNGISVYLNHSKARILAEVLKSFIENPEANDNCGVTSGSSIICFSTGKDFNSKFPLVIIRKVDESGNVSSSFAYEVKGDYYFAVTNFSEKSNGQYGTRKFPDLELRQLLTMLEEYYKAETRAIAYTVVDETRWNDYRTSMKLNRIGEKLGLDMSIGGSRQSSSTSYFSSNGPSSPASQSNSDDGGLDAYVNATMDDLY